MSEWGIPDWRDPEAYGNISEWTFNRWRWEFYRRRDDLRTYFDAEAEAHYRAMIGVFDNQFGELKPSEIGFSIPVSQFDRERLNFGYAHLPNPRIGNQPEWLLVPLASGRSPDFIIEKRRYNGYLDWFETAFKAIGASLSDKERRLITNNPSAYTEVYVKENEIAFVIDLDRPLENQIRELKRKSQDQQRRRHGQTLQERRHEKKWFGYLRTLDARTDGATWSQISCLHPTTAQTEQTARDIWEAANGLRFNL